MSFDSHVRMAADGSLDVRETIAVRAEGDNIRRGIYRDFPTRYKDANGQRFVVDFEVLSLQRNGVPEPYFTQNRSNGVRVNFGDDDFLPVPAEHVYELRYRTTRQIGFFDDHDELYWNATGHGWAFPIERASARIDLPVATDDLRTDEYTGAAGSRAGAARVVRNADGATWTLERALAPGEGMTVVLGFPKGIVAPPSEAQRMRWMLRDLAGPIVIGLAFVLMLLGYIAVWLKIGRDPPRGTVVALYDPPPGHTPAGLRYLRRQAYDNVCFSSDIVALAVAGHLRIEREEGGLLSKDTWTLQRRPDAAPATALSPHRALAEGLFPGRGETLELKTENAARLSAAKSKHAKALRAQYVPSHFRGNYVWSILGIPYAFAAFVVAAVLSRGNDLGIVLAILGMLLMLVLVVVFAFLLRRRTPQGRALLDRIEGLRLYLGVAERDELARLDVPEPALDADRYQALLPFALALDVEAAWTRRFTAAVGAAGVEAAARSAHWVGGSAFARDGFAGIGHALSSDFSSQVASAASPPGSSSGGGGGGFSGGGGGGGGGGGR
nr:DUF2207 domain-containing protein [Chiayiivirga flava]